LQWDLAGNISGYYTNNYTIDTIPPTASSNPVGGDYNSNQNVSLFMSEPGSIYYTTDEITPTTEYNTSFTITGTIVLKYLSVDLAGNKPQFTHKPIP